GTLGEHSEFIDNLRTGCEKSLYFFAKEVLGYTLLTPSLHKPVCEFLQEFPPYRKLILIPRDHFKTTMSQAFAIHLFIQPDGSNIYFPEGLGNLNHSEGASTRILLASKTSDLAKVSLGAITTQFEQNMLLRSLWPNVVWENPRRQAKAWNNERIFLPRRETIFKEASIETIGVGGTRTGYHFNVNLFDDLIDIEDRNSTADMATAIEWYIASRAFLEKVPEHKRQSLEVTTGTHWAVHDLYSYIKENEPSVEVYIRSIVEDGKPILPEKYSMEEIEAMKASFGPLFPLLYMNNPIDPELVDFDMALIRTFRIEGSEIILEDDERDLLLAEKVSPGETPMRPRPDMRGRKLTPDVMNDIRGRREEYLRFRSR
ncbi:MAG: hypothetical protein V3W09_04390, partial [Nitrososphaerales archaeon]